MPTKKIAILVFIVFIIILLVGIIYFEPSFNKPQTLTPVPTNQKEPQPTLKPGADMSVDRIKTIEDKLDTLKNKQDNEDSLIDDLSEKVKDLSTASASLSNKRILDVKQTQGSSFSTTSTAYTSMNNFVNVSCLTKCTLWINYFSSSKNDNSNNLNTYGIFINGVDQGVYSEGNIFNPNNAIPISLNAALPKAAGSYTVEIKVKTSGGTLNSDISFLQVMAVEQ